jgi:single-stranded-DNA-specific exonuclease
MRTWLDPTPLYPPDEFCNAIGGHPMVAEILYRRGYQQVDAAKAFLDPTQYTVSSATQLPDMQCAVDRIEQAVHRGENILVWGDFDVDGQTSTALLVEALRSLGARVTYHIPVRAAESHGVNLPVLTNLLEQDFKLLLTCDTGITAHESIGYAQEHGVDVIVTDHHDLPPTLPPAFALVDPKRLPLPHPLGSLSGVGVAYKLVEELYRHADRTSELAGFLDLVALGLVADLASLRDDTRYLVQRGLDVLRRTRRKGLLAMMDAASLNPSHLTEEHISFILAPRLNALGRLDDANPAVELLTTNDESRAKIIAAQLEGLNARRKLLTSQVLGGALSQIEKDPSLAEGAVLVLAHPEWPAGVVGIVASELVERFNKPTILIASPPNTMARGSARSIEGINISAAIAACSNLLLGFGGHPMAAGLAIDPERIPHFRRALNRAVNEMLAGATIQPTLTIDAYLDLDDLSVNLATELNRLSPFGMGNPPVTLATRRLKVMNSAKLGREGEHLQVTVSDEKGLAQRIIWWGGAAWPMPDGLFDLAYTVRNSSYLGQPELTIEWLEARPVEEPTVAPPPHAEIEVIDYRQEAHPIPVLQKLVAEENVQVWAEGEAKKIIAGKDRNELEPSPVLAIWTTPPGPNELNDVLARVSPHKVYVFAIDPNENSLESFIKRLWGLVQFSLNHYKGAINLTSLAAATAQRKSTIRKGLSYLQNRGKIKIKEVISHKEQDDVLELELGTALLANETVTDTVSIKALMEETAAYRNYFSKAGLQTFIQILPPPGK